MQMQRSRPRKPNNLTSAIAVSVVLHLLLFVLVPFSGTGSGSRSGADSGQRMVLTALEFGWAEDPTTAAGKDSAKDPAPEVRQEPAVAETPDESESEQTKDQLADAAEPTEPTEQTTAQSSSEQEHLDSGENFANSEQGAGSQDATPDSARGAPPGETTGTPRISGATEGRPPRIELPRPLAEISPEYPVHARRRGLEGVVVIRVTISPSGEPVDTTIVSPSEHSQLNEAAVSAVRAARFQPGTIDEHPSEMSLSIRIVFEVS